MIELTEIGHRVVLAALRSASSQIGLLIEAMDGEQDEPRDSRYARVKAGPEYWRETGNSIEGATLEFSFAAPVGMVTGWFVANAAGQRILVDVFDEPYDFSTFGGRLKVTPTFGVHQSES